MNSSRVNQRCPSWLLTSYCCVVPVLAIATAAYASNPDGNWVRFTADRAVIDLSGGVSQLYFGSDASIDDSLNYKRLYESILVDSLMVNGAIRRIQSVGQLDNVTVHSTSLLQVLQRDQATRLKRRISRAVPADTLKWHPRKGEYVKLPDVSVYYAVKLPDELIIDSAIAHLSSVSGISQVAELGYGVLDAFPYFEPDDPLYPDQWNLHDTLDGSLHVHATWHRDFQQGDGDVIVGIVDAGVQDDHEDLDGKVVGGESGVYWYNPGHGTRVAGLVGAITDNDLGVASVATQSQMTVWNGYDETDLIDDMWYAILNAPYARVLNLSWHWPDGDDPALEYVCATANYWDVILVASTGNDGQQQINYPAGYDDYVIAVGACDEDGERLSCSNYGSHVDFVAPGTDVYTTEYYDFESGWAQASAIPSRYYHETECATSWAAPQVTGLVALLLSYEPDITFDEVKDKLIAAASQQTRDNYVGYGVIDAEALLDGYMCPVAMTGDVNETGTISSSDIIYIVNYVFYSGPDPLPCVAAADVNCDGYITSADAIYLTAYVFQAGSPPCNVCELIDQEVWSCP